METPVKCKTFKDASTHHPGSRFQVSLVDSTPSGGAPTFTVQVNVDRDTFFAPDRACDVHNSCMRGLADRIGQDLTDDLQKWVHDKHRPSIPVEQCLTGDCCGHHRSILDTQLGKIVNRYAKDHDPSRQGRVKSLFSKKEHQSWMTMRHDDRPQVSKCSNGGGSSLPGTQDTITAPPFTCVYASEL